METTNLILGLIAVATAAIAAAAIVGAYFSWAQGRQQVVVEAFEMIKVDAAGVLHLSLAVTLCNRRRSSIQPLLLEVRGLPNADIGCAEGPAKGARHKPNEAPFPELPIPPFESREATFDIAFDWQAARAAAPAGGGDLRWQAVVTFSDRKRYGQRWTRELDLAFQGAELHRLTSAESAPLERRGPRRPFSGASNA